MATTANMKTNKSFRKRLRVTRNKKVLARKKGVGHYNAKQPRTKRLGTRRPDELQIDNKTLGRFLPGA